MNTHTDILSIFASRAFGINPSRIPPEIEAEIGRRMAESVPEEHGPKAQAELRRRAAYAGTAERQHRRANRLERVKALHAEGKTTREIADALGVKTSLAKADLRDLWLKPNPGTQHIANLAATRARQRDRADAMVKKVIPIAHLRVCDIAAKMGIPATTANRYRRRAREIIAAGEE